MEKKHPKWSPERIVRLVVAALLAAWAAVSLARVVQQTLSSAGGNDLYTYWYAGHFLREGKDPFAAFIAGELPSVPVRYLDRTVTDLDEVIFPGLVPAPASPPAAFYLFAPLAFLSWKAAKLAWLVLNLLLLGLIPLLLGRFFPLRPWLDRLEVFGLACVLVGLTATRYAAASGQITFLVLDLMLATVILAPRRPWLAGLLLGLALSKYSLSIGILLLFTLLEPKPKLVLAAVLVQLAGVAALLLQTGTSLASFVHEYLQMVNLHANMEGIHLAGLFPRSGWDVGIGLALTAVVALPLLVWRIRLGGGFFRPLPDLSRTVLAVLLSLWSLLVVYHRAYDAMVMIVFLALAAGLARHPQAWRLSKPLRAGLLAWLWQRWEIEVVHREVKSALGIGEKKCWNQRSAVLSVQWSVWSYALLVLVGYRTWGLCSEWPTRSGSLVARRQTLVHHHLVALLPLRPVGPLPI